MNRTYIILDLEATCYDRTDHKVPEGFVNEIIEIGAVKMTDKGDVMDEFQIFVKPMMFPIISNFCKDLTSIMQHDIDSAPDFKQALFSFKSWYSDLFDKKHLKFVSWGNYDKTQFVKDSKLHGIDHTWINDQNHVSLKHVHARWKGSVPVGLGKACRIEGIEFEGTAHRGIDDARMVAKIAQLYIKELNSLR